MQDLTLPPPKKSSKAEPLGITEAGFFYRPDALQVTQA